MMKVFEKHWKIYLVLLLAIQAFLLALNYASIGIDTGGDTASYVEPALEFLKTGRMQYGNGEPILFRTPGYPFFLAVILLVFVANDKFYEVICFNSSCISLLRKIFLFETDS